MNEAMIRLICRVLVACMGAIPLGSYAGMIATDQLAAATPAATARDKVRDFIDRSEVQAQFRSLGVNPAAAKARVNALTDAEVASIAGRIDKLPAGGFSGWAGFVGLVIVELIWYFWVK